MVERDEITVPLAASRPEDLFRDEPPAYPHESRMLREGTAEYLVDLVREHRRARRVVVDLRLDAPALAPDEERRLRDDWRSFYRVECARARTVLAVNTTEGRRSLFVGLLGTLIAIAVIVPVRLYTGPDFFFLEFLLVVVIWILMWDSLEVLLFDSMFLRMRRAAVDKLRDAEIRIRYRAPGASRTAEPVSGTGQI